MNYRKFCNYLTAIVNAENARKNNHDNEASATFEQNRIWALNRLKEIFHDEDNNLERWMKGDRCIFRMNHSEQPMSVNIGKDTEAEPGEKALYPQSPCRCKGQGEAA